MSLRPLFSVLIGIAMLLAPLAISGGQAMAMAPAADRHARTMDNGHCADQPADGDQGTIQDDGCCPAMCGGIAVAPPTSIEPHGFSQLAQRPAPPQLQRSFLAELPTPPPRLA
jgi:hypothetical protein